MTGARGAPHRGGKALECLSEDLGTCEAIVGVCATAQLLNLGCGNSVLEDYHVGDSRLGVSD